MGQGSRGGELRGLQQGTGEAEGAGSGARSPALPGARSRVTALRRPGKGRSVSRSTGAFRAVTRGVSPAGHSQGGCWHRRPPAALTGQAGRAAARVSLPSLIGK